MTSSVSIAEMATAFLSWTFSGSRTRAARAPGCKFPALTADRSRQRQSLDGRQSGLRSRSLKALLIIACARMVARAHTPARLSTRQDPKIVTLHETVWIDKPAADDEAQNPSRDQANRRGLPQRRRPSPVMTGPLVLVHAVCASATCVADPARR